MAKWGSCDFRQLKGLQDKINQLKEDDAEAFCRACAKELAARLLAKVIKRTPVGDYPSRTGKYGGTLRRGWTAKSEREAELTAVFGGGQGGGAYANSLEIKKVGNTYEVEIVNPCSYASYVEYGHRTRGGKGWVNGRYMMTISEQELDVQSPAILERKLLKYLGDVFNA